MSWRFAVRDKEIAEEVAQVAYIHNAYPSNQDNPLILIPIIQNFWG